MSGQVSALRIGAVSQGHVTPPRVMSQVLIRLRTASLICPLLTSPHFSRMLPTAATTIWARRTLTLGRFAPPGHLSGFWALV